MNRVYFPGLNTIRLYAALCVVIGHTVSFATAHTFTVDLHTPINLLILSGYEAVSLFFVLSGFLITYILLNERRTTGEIEVKRFYIKRAFRIQPLYILITALTLAVSGIEQPSSIGLISILLLSPHLVHHALGALGHLWSIGVEEWFYFVLPPLLRRVSVPALAGTVIAIRLLIALAVPDLMLGDAYNAAPALFHFLRFECMAIGALGAWMVINHYWLLRWVYRIEIPNLVILALIILLRFQEGIAFNLVSSCVFIVFILNVATNPNRRLKLEHPTLSTLGTVTYGVYMYHPLVTFAVTAVFVRLGAVGVFADGLLYVCVALSSVLVAVVSYRVFELPVLRLRETKRATVGALEVG
jgi:peptidoglycan/LPS O-acetylase OafA/YrhL